MYSQHDEEATILRLLGGESEAAAKEGVKRSFLDVGAYDGLTFSNTRRLAELGWHGVHVEPAPKQLLGLMDRYKGDPKHRIVAAAIGSGAVIPMQIAGCVSTLSDRHAGIWRERAQTDYQEILVPTITANTLLAKVGSDFEVVSIDVEGENFEVFEAMVSSLSRTRILVVEHENKQDSFVELAKHHGFTEAARTLENLIFHRLLTPQKFGT
jgi:FkbM family methyltransferase